VVLTPLFYQVMRVIFIERVVGEVMRGLDMHYFACSRNTELLEYAWISYQQENCREE
jgi:hypothetical protein